jgi:CRP-like cAMP-binding protein
MQVVSRRCLDFKNRIESFSLETTSQRLGQALVHFADRLGSAMDGGATTIPPLTHEVLAQYVGTSREIVSHQMSEFRTLGYVRYSRKGITIQDGLKSWLRVKERHAG